MPKISKPSNKKANNKTKKTIIAAKKVKTAIKISKTYIPKENEKYMCEKHQTFFKLKLQEWKKEIVKANNEALYNGSIDDNSVSADIVDQASSYTDKTAQEKHEKEEKVYADD